jgi:crossover junction endodeoxyribonuclease RuvC
VTHVLGIDPGQSGGFALLSPDAPAKAWKMPATEADVWLLMRDIQHDVNLPTSMSFGPNRGRDIQVHRGVLTVWIEKVGAMPKQGVSSTFKFGRGYGFLRGCITALALPWNEVAPGVWQRKLQCLSGGDKNVTKARAQQLYPHLRITHATADALLIASYGAMQQVAAVQRAEDILA